MTNQVVRFLVALTIAANLGGCSGKKEVNWKEEVRLSNGSMVVIERSQGYRRVREPWNEPGWLFDHARLQAALTSLNQKISWEGRAQPLVLDVDREGQIYLLATIETFDGLREYQLQEGMWYVAFRFNGKTWTRIGLEQFPKGMSPNLLASTWQLFIKQQEPAGFLVRLPLKQTMDSRAALAEHYKQLINLN